MSVLTQNNWPKLILFFAILLLVACNEATPAETGGTGAEIAVAIPTAPPAVERGETEQINLPITEATPVKFTLRIWMTVDVNTLPTTAGGDVLASQLQLFDDNHPDVELDVQVKGVVEQGGSLSYLRAGQEIAPKALPDVIILPSSELITAYEDGLIYSLDNLTSTNGLYPAARGLGSINDKLYGYPFALTNFQHFVYNGNVITDELPTSWSALIVRERAQTLIAAAGQQGAALALQLYHAQGGTLAEGENGFVFQSVPLTAALAQIYDGLNAGVLQPSSAETDTSDMAWAAFQSGAVNVAMVDTAQLFAKRAKGNKSLFGSIPGPNEPTTPIVQGLVYTVTTPDATRQSLSAELISWLTEANNLGEWSIAAQQLPAKPNAFNSWPVDPYTNFIKSELSLAKAHPKTLSTAAQNALGNAVLSIITSPISPDAAADFVIQTLSP